MPVRRPLRTGRNPTMARPQRPERKAELLEQILDYLQDKTLAQLSFRTLAEGLGISSYVLVYHFGNREQLVNEIVASIEGRLDDLKDADVTQWTRADFATWIHEAWNWTMHERNRQLQRLEFEAAMQDLTKPHPRLSARRNFALWEERTCRWLVTQGVDVEDAATDARLFTATLYGLEYDHVINDDTDGASEAFEELMRVFWRILDVRLRLGERTS
jgi:AcrR family transcriptional regulator